MGGTAPASLTSPKYVAQVHNFSVVSVNEDQIAANLVKHGPLASKDKKHLIIVAFTIGL